jgi:hypothetical protein
MNTTIIGTRLRDEAGADFLVVNVESVKKSGWVAATCRSLSRHRGAHLLLQTQLRRLDPPTS